MRSRGRHFLAFAGRWYGNGTEVHNCPCLSRLPAPTKTPGQYPRGLSPLTVAVDQLAPPVETVVEANVDHMDLLVEADIPRNGHALTCFDITSIPIERDIFGTEI